MRVEDILRRKGSEVSTIMSRASVETALHRLSLDNIGALVVSDRDLIPEGIVSERDIVRALSAHGAEALRMEVKDVMTKNVRTCPPSARLEDVMATMTNRRFRHMPVVVDGKLAGIVSIGDIVKHRLDELELEAGVLRDRVLGSG